MKDYFEYLERRSLSWDRLRYDELAAFKPWLRLPTAARRGEISVLSATVSACTESTINRKLAAITSFYEFHRRHGVDMALTIRDASRPVVSTSTSFRPFLAHVAAAADVTRSWLYTQPEIRAAIDRLRDLNGRSIAAPVPAESEALSAPWFADSGPHTDAIRNSAVKSPSCAISSPPLTEKLRAARRRTYEPAVVDLPERRRS